ncbi:MAG: hypothetical protein ACPG5W_04430 [Flavobacteriales bacterium]
MKEELNKLAKSFSDTRENHVKLNSVDEYRAEYGSQEVDDILNNKHDIEITPAMDRDDVFNLVSNELWGDLSEAIANDHQTPIEVFSHMTAMEEITQSITNQLPIGYSCKVWIDAENNALGKFEVETNKN